MEGFKQVDCFSTNLQFWKFLGIYPLAVSHPLLYSIYSKIFIFSFIVMYSVLLTVNLYFLPKKIEYYIEELIFYFSVLSVFAKVLTFFFKRNKILDIINFLERDIFQPESELEIDIVNKTKRVIRRYWIIYAAVCLASNMTQVFVPLFIHLIFKTEIDLPISSYSFLPDNIKQLFFYPLHFYQGVGMHFHVHCAINIDSFFVGLMLLTIAQLNILENKFINVTKGSRGHYTTSLQNEERLILKLNKALAHYEEVARFCSLVEDTFSFNIFLHFGMGSYIICMCLIKFTMPAPWQYFIFLSTYSSAMVVQILIPCWFGSRIVDESCLLAHAIYSCDWTPRSKRFKSSLRLFVERASRPLSITGWKMFPLSLVTFTSIMNTAYSFYTLLRHMQSR